MRPFRIGRSCGGASGSGGHCAVMWPLLLRCWLITVITLSESTVFAAWLIRTPVGEHGFIAQLLALPRVSP